MTIFYSYSIYHTAKIMVQKVKSETKMFNFSLKRDIDIFWSLKEI
jgi:hypothetical protein